MAKYALIAYFFVGSQTYEFPYPTLFDDIAPCAALMVKLQHVIPSGVKSPPPNEQMSPWFPGGSPIFIGCSSVDEPEAK